MRLISCYHPKVVINKYTGKQVVARCGKCPACLDARSASWVQRLDEEMLHHKYTFFATLQFDEQNIFQVVLLDPSDRPNNMPAYINYSTGQIFDLADISDVSPADIQYCEDTKFLGIHNISDYQNFIKSLRKEIFEKYNESIRYYFALEFGPSTFRPHAHSLFFFSSSLLAKDFGKLLVKHWKYGYVFDPHPVSGSASQYVASYVNSFVSLPAIYRHKDLCQKSLFSKRPPIGSFTWSEETFKRLFDSSLSELTLFRKSSERFIHVPFWRFISDRIYPKIVAFDRLSYTDRITLYELGKRFIEDTSSFACFTSVNERSRISEINIMYLANFLNRPYWSFYRDLFKTKLPFAHSKFYGLNEDSLVRFIRITSRVAMNCLSWNVSIADYVTKIEKYYYDLEKKQLTDYYHLQDEYFKSHPIKDFLSFNPNFCYSVCGLTPDLLQPWHKVYLSYYAPDLLSEDKPIFIDYRKCSAMQSLRGLHEKIFFDNTKQKKANDYLLANKDKFQNIINFNLNSIKK